MNISAFSPAKYLGILTVAVFFASGFVTTTAFGATNLIANPSFETGTSSVPDSWQQGNWGTNSATFTYPIAAGHTGVAARVDISGYTDGDAKWFFSDVPVTGGTKYTFSDFSQSDGISDVTVRYTLSGGAFSYVDLGTISGTGAWQQFQKTFTTPANAVSLTVMHIISRNGYLVVDDYNLEAVTVTPPTNSGLISNGDLESGSTNDPTNWMNGFWGTMNVAFAYPVAGFNSTRAVQITVSQFTSGDAKWYFNQVPVTPGKVYTFSDAYKSTAPTTLTVQVQNTDNSVSYYWLGSPAASANWTTFTGQFTAPDNAKFVTVFHSIAAVGTLTTDSYSFSEASGSVGAFPVGMVTIDFDDGYASHYQKAVPILNSAGIHASFHVITGEVGDSGSMTWKQLTAMKAAGHEIGAHTRTHPHLPQITLAKAQTEIAGSKSDLVAHGFAAETFVYPYGEYNDAVKQIVKNAGFIGARSVDTGFDTPTSDKFILMDQHIEKNTTVAQLQKLVDQAIANKKWVIFELHEQMNNCGSEQYCNTPATLQALVNYIKSKGVKTVTLSEGIKLMQ